jgi:hypothetical protein
MLKDLSNAPLGEVMMARFIAIHQFAENVNLEETRTLRQNLHRELRGTTLEWLNSWYIPTNGQLICEWEAPDAKAVRQVLEDSGALRIAPLALLEEVVLAGPRDYPGEFENV